ncbi:acetolactate synthase small subunit [Thermodesulfitimonas autotrophica]|uniref:acetolactate synthase small subunit n=1 Tax=Thermodesulfitimonas autotrophica TaxID=1894989 RepID=UPI002FE1F6B3
MKHTLAVLALNKPGVLARIAGLLSRRNFNIESITAGHTEESDVSRLTIVVQGDDRVIDQVVKQVSKLIDVLKVERLAQNVIDRELALIKVKADPSRRSDIVDIVQIFRAHIVDVGRETMVVEMTGDEEKIDALCAVLSEHGILEMVRTGKVTLTRGAHTVKG